MNIIKKITGKIFTIALILLMVVTMAMPAHAKLVFTNDIFENEADIFRIGETGDATTTNFELQFGDPVSNYESLLWDYSNDWFEVSNDFNFSENKLLEAEIEVVSALPGGAGGLGGAGTGRIVYTDTLDNVAPGCTVDPWCPAGTYIWDGSSWISLQGTSSTNLTKVVTVGASGMDYTTIDAAAAYLATRSGGIMLLAAETHNVTTAIDLTNVTLIGKDASRTDINITGSGQLDTFDTFFKFLTIGTGAITDDMAIDVQTGSSALIFEYVDVNIQDAGDVLIDSNGGVAPTIIAKFIKSNQTSGGSGTILKTQASANLNAASDIYVDSRSSDNPLQMEDWDVTLVGGGSVYTDGIISPIPADTIIVSPNMNLQGAIDSLESAGNGGLITLLPGTHSITSTLTIEDDNIEIVGYGDASIISASGIATGVTVGAIQVGTADGATTVDGVVLKDFKLNVTGTGANDIHGIRVCGGVDNRVDNVTVQKVSGASGTGATAKAGIQMIDGAAGCTGTCVLTRPVIINSRVFGDSGASAYFTDGIHVTSDPTITGVWGNNQGVSNALLDGNFVDYPGETAYVFVGVNNSSLYNNRASRMGAAGNPNPYGIYIGNSTDINMNANVFSGSLDTSTIAIGVESFNVGALKTTTDSIFSNNIIDGTGNGGVGFGTGFLIGNASNTGVHRNSFHNNTITGAAAAVTTAINLRGNADENAFTDNDISGGTNAWDTGIGLISATQEQNIIRDNRWSNVTSVISDSGTGTRIGVSHHRSTGNPTVNDDIGDGYEVGTVWINTSTGNSYILVDSTTGAANWQQINGAGGSGSLDDAYNNDAGERTVLVDNGDVSWDISSTYNFVIDLQGTGDFLVQNSGVTFATFDDSGDVTIGGAIYNTSTATKYLWLELAGSVRTSATIGAVNGGTTPVVRFDGTDDSRARWSLPVPDDWESGTDINVEVFWSPADGTAGNVYYELDYQSWADGETISGSTTLNSTQAAPGTTLQLDAFTFTIPNAALATDDMVNIRLSREPGNVADTYAGDVNIHLIRINYTGKKLL
ncbi:hypothetical protein KKF73_03615 [Patescibacteria group bacterium]|nr:hypothetical protein [Patescibacteria group bacterium]